MVTRSTARVIVVGVVCIVAIAMGASSITAMVPGTTGETDLGQDDPIGPNVPETDDDGGLGPLIPGHDGEGPGTGAALDLERCVEPLDSIPGTILFFAGFLAVLFAVKRRYSSGMAMLAGYALAPATLTGYFLLTQCGSTTGGWDDSDGPPVTNVTDGTQFDAPNVDPLVALGVLALFVVGAAAVAVRASGDQARVVDAAEKEEEGTDLDADAADLAAAAGAAADRLERFDAEVDNEVYRAWTEMVQLLDVASPETATPGEFADAAVGAGLNESDVDELTRLFEEVRYGERDADERERHAVEVLRSIERTYGETDER